MSPKGADAVKQIRKVFGDNLGIILFFHKKMLWVPVRIASARRSNEYLQHTFLC